MDVTVENLLQQKYELLAKYRMTKVEAVKFNENSQRWKELTAELECIEQEIAAIDHDIEQLCQNVKSDADSNQIDETQPQIQSQQPTQQIVEPKQATNTNTKKGLHGFVVFLIVAIIISAFIFGVVKIIDCTKNPNNTDGTKKLLSRSARRSDITITQSDEFSLSDTYKLVPNVDIENLEVTINFLDSSQNTIKTKTKTVGNVVKNGEYSFSFSMSEFSFTEIFQITYWQYDVTGGTVKYFS